MVFLNGISWDIIINNGTMELYGFSIYWEFHNPNWPTPSFLRGVGIPPTRYLWPYDDPLWQLSDLSTTNQRERPGFPNVCCFSFVDGTEYINRWLEKVATFGARLTDQCFQACFLLIDSKDVLYVSRVAYFWICINRRIRNGLCELIPSFMAMEWWPVGGRLLCSEVS